MRRKKKYKGVTLVTDRHGKRRYRLRLTLKGRKISTYINAEFGSPEFERQYAAALNGERGTQTRRDTFSYLIESYMGSLAFKSLAKTTRKQKLHRLNWLREAIGKARYSEMTAAHVERLMAKTTKTTANKIRADLSTLFDHATRLGLFNRPNPARLAASMKFQSRGFHSWSDAQVEQYRLYHPTGTTARLVLELALSTAAACVDLTTMTRAHIKSGAITYTRKKTGITAIGLPISATLDTELKALPSGQFILIATGRSAAFTAKGLGYAFAKWCAAAGLKGCSLHGLRKARARSLAESGASENEIAAFLAHATTGEAQRYTRAANRERLARNAAERENQGQTNVSNLVVQPLPKTAQAVDNKRNF